MRLSSLLFVLGLLAPALNASALKGSVAVQQNEGKGISMHSPMAFVQLSAHAVVSSADLVAAEARVDTEASEETDAETENYTDTDTDTDAESETEDESEVDSESESETDESTEEKTDTAGSVEGKTAATSAAKASGTSSVPVKDGATVLVEVKAGAQVSNTLRSGTGAGADAHSAVATEAKEKEKEKSEEKGMTATTVADGMFGRKSGKFKCPKGTYCHKDTKERKNQCDKLRECWPCPGGCANCKFQSYDESKHGSKTGKKKKFTKETAVPLSNQDLHNINGDGMFIVCTACQSGYFRNLQLPEGGLMGEPPKDAGFFGKVAHKVKKAVSGKHKEFSPHACTRCPCGCNKCAEKKKGTLECTDWEPFAIDEEAGQFVPGPGLFCDGKAEWPKKGAIGRAVNKLKKIVTGNKEDAKTSATEYLKKYDVSGKKLICDATKHSSIADNYYYPLADNKEGTNACAERLNGERRLMYVLADRAAKTESLHFREQMKESFSGPAYDEALAPLKPNTVTPIALRSLQETDAAKFGTSVSLNTPAEALSTAQTRLEQSRHFVAAVKDTLKELADKVKEAYWNKHNARVTTVKATPMFPGMNTPYMGPLNAFYPMPMPAQQIVALSPPVQNVSE